MVIYGCCPSKFYKILLAPFLTPKQRFPELCMSSAQKTLPNCFKKPKSKGSFYQRAQKNCTKRSGGTRAALRAAKRIQTCYVQWHYFILI